MAYCWLFHLIGDIHQPLHSTALVNARFPEGDRGGNLIPVVQGKNLHSLWDNLLGRQSRPNDVQREVAQLAGRQNLWEVDTKDVVAGWLRESHQLAKSVVYSPEILAAINASGELQPINLPESYVKAAGETARARVVAAGVRLAVRLVAKPSDRLPPVRADSLAAKPQTTEPSAPNEKTSAPKAQELSYWLNLSGNVRHNSTCRFYHNTKRGRPCGPDEGKACGICGG